MRKDRKRALIPVFVFIALVLLAVVLRNINSGTSISESEIATYYIAVMPAIFLIAIGFISIVMTLGSRARSKAGIMVFLGGLEGVFFAYFVHTLYNLGLVIDEYITGTITINELDAIIVIIWIVVGALLGVLSDG